jgi:replicative DNA helicase
MNSPALADIDSERVLLGCVLLNNEAYQSAGQIRALDFTDKRHRAAWDAIRELLGRGEIADVLTVNAAVQEMGGDVDLNYLDDLCRGIPRVSNVSDWAKLILRASLRRQVARAAGDLSRAAGSPEVDAGDLIAQGQADLAAIASRAGLGGGGGIWRDNHDDARQAMEETRARMVSENGILGLQTGIRSLDAKLQGIRPGQLGLIGGRLKTGKSVLVLQIATNVSSAGGTVCFFSLEMSGVGLMRRRLASEAEINLNTLWSATPEDQDYRLGRLEEAHDAVLERDLRISTSTYTVAEMRAAVKATQKETPVALVVVDYLQIVHPALRTQKRNEDVAEIARDLKRLAVDLDVPVIAAAQLSRAQEGKADHRPSAADLAESDVLGRECDWAILIHREPKPRPGEDPRSTRGMADLILAANRDGQAGTTRVAFKGFMQRFVDEESKP